MQQHKRHRRLGDEIPENTMVWQLGRDRKPTQRGRVISPTLTSPWGYIYAVQLLGGRVIRLSQFDIQTDKEVAADRELEKIRKAAANLRR